MAFFCVAEKKIGEPNFIHEVVDGLGAEDVIFGHVQPGIIPSLSEKKVHNIIHFYNVHTAEAVNEYVHVYKHSIAGVHTMPITRMMRSWPVMCRIVLESLRNKLLGSEFGGYYVRIDQT